jgi:Flp pilus assembly protein TadG
VITGWLVKVALVVALAGGAMVEIGSPFVARNQCGDSARAAAKAAANELATNRDTNAARAAAEDAIRGRGEHLDSFDVSGGQARVTVSKTAKSYVLRHFQRFKKWYDVRSSASAGAP